MNVQVRAETSKSHFPYEGFGSLSSRCSRINRIVLCTNVLVRTASEQKSRLG